MMMSALALIVVCSLAGAFTVSLVPPELFRPLVPVALTAILIYIRLFGFYFLHSAACARVLNAAATGAALLCFGALGADMWSVGCATFPAVVIALIAKTAWDVLQQ